MGDSNSRSRLEFTLGGRGSCAVIARNGRRGPRAANRSKLLRDASARFPVVRCVQIAYPGLCKAPVTRTELAAGQRMPFLLINVDFGRVWSVAFWSRFGPVAFWSGRVLVRLRFGRVAFWSRLVRSRLVRLRLVAFGPVAFWSRLVRLRLVVFGPVAFWSRLVRLRFGRVWSVAFGPVAFGVWLDEACLDSRTWRRATIVGPRGVVGRESHKAAPGGAAKPHTDTFLTFTEAASSALAGAHTITGVHTARTERSPGLPSTILADRGHIHVCALSALRLALPLLKQPPADGGGGQSAARGRRLVAVFVEGGGEASGAHRGAWFYRSAASGIPLTRLTDHPSLNPALDLKVHGWVQCHTSQPLVVHVLVVNRLQSCS
jgi:hypothetical protein